MRLLPLKTDEGEACTGTTTLTHIFGVNAFLNPDKYLHAFKQPFTLLLSADATRLALSNETQTLVCTQVYGTSPLLSRFEKWVAPHSFTGVAWL